MNTPAPSQPQGPSAKKMGFVTASTVAVMLLWAALIESERRVYVPYFDVFGVLTVCAGITGPDIQINKVYTDPECDALEQNYINQMLKRIGQCVKRVDLALHQVIAWGHFAYNVGNGAFCSSTAASYLNAKRDSEACEQIMRWTFGTSRRTGDKVDCSNRANRCYGLYTRRLRERAMCHGDMNAFNPEWKPA